MPEHVGFIVNLGVVGLLIFLSVIILAITWRLRDKIHIHNRVSVKPLAVKAVQNQRLSIVARAIDAMTPRKAAVSPQGSIIIEASESEELDTMYVHELESVWANMRVIESLDSL